MRWGKRSFLSADMREREKEKDTEGHTADTQGGYWAGEGHGSGKMFREEML